MTTLSLAARGFLDVPFRACGRSREGVDCAGLVVLSLQEIGFDVPELGRYDLLPHCKLVEQIHESLGLAFDCVWNCNSPLARRPPSPSETRVLPPPSSAQGEECSIAIDDVLVFDSPAMPGHMGIVSRVEPMMIIHAFDHPMIKRVVESPVDLRWRSRIESVWRLR